MIAHGPTLRRRLVANLVPLGLACALLACSASQSAAQENDDCLICHSDPDLTGHRGEIEVPMHVDAEQLDRSVHAGLDCVMCHQDLAQTEFPHADDVARVDCGVCHERQATEQRKSLHGTASQRGDELAPTCASCHGTHDILPDSDPLSPVATMNIPMTCGRCHREGSPVSLTHHIAKDKILEHYSMSMHGDGLFHLGLTVTAVCTSCHTSHSILPHTDPRSSIHRDNIADVCTRCHAEIERVHRKVIEGRLWRDEPSKIPSCVDCHSPHQIRRVFYPAGVANQDCLTCHGKPDLTMQRDGATVSLFVDEGAYAGSAHAGTACAQCHTGVTPSRVRACETVSSKVDCSICHAGPVEQYGASKHGELFAAGDPDAPSCLDCHDRHATPSKTTPTSPTFPRNVPVLCGRCHRAGEQAALRIDSEVPDIVKSYEFSIHGKGLLQSGLLVTATCTSCHTTHGELPPDDPRSSTHPDRIAATCGTCHHGVEETFKASIHSPAVGDPAKDLPTCNDCHSSHTITRTDRDDFRFLMMNRCGRCHQKESETFFDTFHGKVSRLGSAGAAKCYDCHGTHDILPAYNPASRLSRDHVVQTCGKCHPGSHRRFAGYLTHATHHDPERYPWLFWSFWGMTALLVGTLGFALLHTLAWLTRLWLSRDEWRAHRARASADGQKQYRRFNRLQRGLHLSMLLSFFTLALTGMALKFAYMGWAQGLSSLLGGFDTMGILHRLGGITLFAVFGVHLWAVIQRKRRRRSSWKQVLSGPNTLMFTFKDVREVIQSIRWFFGLGPRPHYGRYTYWEKFDYFAVFWGVLIIGSTGLVLWFPELFTRLIPGWSINVATIIHSDEALLAVAFIFTIHFFNTHFRPDKFPMDPVIFTGRVTIEELKYDKPGEYETLIARGELEQHLVDPIPGSAERMARIFGFTALGVGLLLIALIVYSMLFGYR